MSQSITEFDTLFEYPECRCRRRIPHSKYVEFQQRVKQGQNPLEVFELLDIYNICCRTSLMTPARLTKGELLSINPTIMPRGIVIPEYEIEFRNRENPGNQPQIKRIYHLSVMLNAGNASRQMVPEQEGVIQFLGKYGAELVKLFTAIKLYRDLDEPTEFDIGTFDWGLIEAIDVFAASMMEFIFRRKFDQQTTINIYDHIISSLDSQLAAGIVYFLHVSTTNKVNNTEITSVYLTFLNGGVGKKSNYLIYGSSDKLLIRKTSLMINEFFEQMQRKNYLSDLLDLDIKYDTIAQIDYSEARYDTINNDTMYQFIDALIKASNNDKNKAQLGEIQSRIRS